MTKDFMGKVLSRGGLSATVAKMIDPGAFAEWHSNTDMPKTFYAEIQYRQSAALDLATSIIGLVVAHPNAPLAMAMEEHCQWRDMGLPVGAREMNTINEKWGVKNG